MIPPTQIAENTLNSSIPSPEQFAHVRVVIGIVTGLSITRLLSGLAGFVQHPSRQRLYPVHIGWTLFLLLSVMHFWWFEFALGQIQSWTFELYVFVTFYAAIFYFTCAMLFPDRIDDYGGYESYFHARKAWFYGLLAAIFLIDLADTAIKGWPHFQSLGVLYPVRQIALALLVTGAIFTDDRRAHLAVVGIALAAQLWWILSRFQLLG